MTFIDYLKSQNISRDTEEGIIFAVASLLRPDATYREMSLIFADLPDISDVFEALWYGYETALDRVNYEREHGEPQPASAVIAEVLDDLRQRCAT